MKSDLNVAPIFLKSNKRIEALMFIYFLALLIGAVIERKLKRGMMESEIDSLPTLPEERHSKGPTWEQIARLFEHHDRHAVFAGKTLLKVFSDPLSETQAQVLRLLKISPEVYAAHAQE
jgi:transposase